MKLTPLGCGFVAALLVLASMFGVYVIYGGNSSNKASPSPTIQSETVPVAANAPGYCRQLAKLPAGLQAAVGNAASGGASEDDRKVIGDTATQLRSAAGDKAVPADLRTILTNAANLLGKLSRGEPLQEAEATSFGATFQSLGEAVDKICSAK